MIISYGVYYSTKVSYPHRLLGSQPMCKETTVGTIVVHRDCPAYSICGHKFIQGPAFPCTSADQRWKLPPRVCKKFTQINSPQCVWNFRFPWSGSFPVHHSESSLGGKNYIGFWNPINELLEMMHYLGFWISFPQKFPIHPDHWQASRCVSLARQQMCIT